MEKDHGSWLARVSGKEVHFIGSFRADTEGYPDDYAWQWHVRSLAHGAESAKGLQAILEAILAGADGIRVDPDGIPVFDAADAQWAFGDKASADAEARRAIAEFQVREAAGLPDAELKDLLRTLDAEIHGLLSITDADQRVRRNVIMRHQELRGLHAELTRELNRRAGIPRCPISMIAKVREFSAGWPKSWKDLSRGARVAHDWQGEMRGILNIRFEDEALAIKAMTRIGRLAEKGSVIPFEYLAISYPKLPARLDILQDIDEVLRRYGMRSHPVLWLAAGKKAHFAICRIPPLPDACGRHDLPAPERFRREAVFKSGKKGMITMWQACRESARHAICERYGFPTGGIDYDAEGRCIGAPFKGRGEI